MALAKYYEDNYLIADERLRDMEERAISKPIIKRKSPKRKVNRRETFCPKRGVIDIVRRGGLYITMEFCQYLCDEQIAVIKGNGWRWDHRRRCWYAACSLPNYDFASEFVHGKRRPCEESEDAYPDGYSQSLTDGERYDKSCPTQIRSGVV